MATKAPASESYRTCATYIQSVAPLPPGGAGAPCFPRQLWLERKELKVFFEPRILTWRKMDQTQDFITTRDILEWANVWHNACEGVVPKFVKIDTDIGSDIRVKFFSGIYIPLRTGNVRS